MADGLGHLAAGFLQAFSVARNQRHQDEEANKYKKAMTQLLELQIDAATRKNQASHTVIDMMSPQKIAATLPQFQFSPEGELGEIQTTKPAGPTVKPGMSLMEIMSDPQGRLAAMESGLSEQMQAADQQASQLELVRGIQSSGKTPLEFLNSQEGGALAVRAGMNPSEFLRAQGGAADPLQAALAAELLQNRQQQNERDRVAAEQAAQTSAANRAQTESTLLRSLEQTSKIAGLNEKLQGSFLEAGVPASSWRRMGAGAVAGLGDVLGFDTKGLRADIDAFDTYKKNLADQLNNLIATGGLDNLTDSKLRQYQDSLASTETSPGAVMSIQGNIAQILLDRADALKIQVPNREQIEANIEKWHGYSTPESPTQLDVPALGQRIAEIANMGIAEIANMGIDELSALASQAEGMTPEMLEAAARRWDELNATPTQ